MRLFLRPMLTGLGFRGLQSPSPLFHLRSTLRSSPHRRIPTRRHVRNYASEAKPSQAPTPRTNVKPTTGAKPNPEAVDVPINLWYHRLGPVSTFFGWFDRTQSHRPLLVQFCTSLTVYFFGDLLAQRIGGEEYDYKRTLRNLVIGGGSSLPGYKWFLWLGNHFNYASKLRSIGTKVLVQQIVFTPIFNTYFFGMQALLSGETAAGVLDRITKAVPESIKNSVKIWPAVTALTFWFIRPQYRFMTSGVVAVFWQSYLSWLNQREANRVHTGYHSEAVKP